MTLVYIFNSIKVNYYKTTKSADYISWFYVNNGLCKQTNDSFVRNILELWERVGGILGKFGKAI